MKPTKIVRLLKADHPIQAVRVQGWIRTKRDAKTFSFIELNDGSCLRNLQIVATEDLDNYLDIRKLVTGAAVSAEGRLIPSQGKGQQWELSADSIAIIGAAPEDYPLQKKRHSDEFLRSIAHLRPRTNKYGALFRMRSELSYAIHRFFHERDFRYIHTPIITASDCEGAGELFRVVHASAQGEDDFFGKDAYLTVSGQLAVEMFALSLGDVYTFGPAFRAEKSNTRRHVAEFWMVEPEIAFCDLNGNMEFAETMVQQLTRYMMDNCSEDLNLFARFVDPSLLERLERIAASGFVRMPYREAVHILVGADRNFTYPVEFGKDLQTEHERFLTEEYCKCPVIVYDYPREIKPFYMRVNPDGQTVAAMDVLVPGVGEIIGGSQREERLQELQQRMQESGLSLEGYRWYLDSRRFGSVPHSGFGLGFERLLMLLTGVSNIRDVIPFPRTPDILEY